MDLCARVSEEWGDVEGVVFQDLSRLSLDTHRREVSDVHGTLPTDIRRKPQVNCDKKTMVM